MITVLEIPPGNQIETIGIPIIKIKDFDDRQYWIPLLDFVAVVEETPEETPLSEKELKLHRQRLNQIYASAKGYRTLYHHEKGVPQYPLPFFNYRKISSRESNFIIDADFPTFERNRHGQIAKFDVKYGEKEVLLEWCEENCEGRYLIKTTVAYFEYFKDASLAKLFNI